MTSWFAIAILACTGAGPAPEPAPPVKAAAPAPRAPAHRPGLPWSLSELPTGRWLGFSGSVAGPRWRPEADRPALDGLLPTLARGAEDLRVHADGAELYVAWGDHDHGVEQFGTRMAHFDGEAWSLFDGPWPGPQTHVEHADPYAPPPSQRPVPGDGSRRGRLANRTRRSRGRMAAPGRRPRRRSTRGGWWWTTMASRGC